MTIQLDMTVSVEAALAEYNEAADDDRCPRARVDALARRWTVLRNRETRGSKAPPEPIRYDLLGSVPEESPEPSSSPAKTTTPRRKTAMTRNKLIPESLDRFKAITEALGYDRYGGGKALAKLADVALSIVFCARTRGLTAKSAVKLAKGLNVPVGYFHAGAANSEAFKAMVAKATLFTGGGKTKPTQPDAPDSPQPAQPSDAPAQPDATPRSRQTPKRTGFASLTCDYTGKPPFAEAEWAKDPDAMCLWCAGTGYPHGDERYGICKCPAQKQPAPLVNRLAAQPTESAADSPPLNAPAANPSLIRLVINSRLSEIRARRDAALREAEAHASCIGVLEELLLA